MLDYDSISVESALEVKEHPLGRKSLMEYLPNQDLYKVTDFLNDRLWIQYPQYKSKRQSLTGLINLLKDYKSKMYIREEEERAIRSNIRDLAQQIDIGIEQPRVLDLILAVLPNQNDVSQQIRERSRRIDTLTGVAPKQPEADKQHKLDKMDAFSKYLEQMKKTHPDKFKEAVYRKLSFLIEAAREIIRCS